MLKQKLVSVFIMLTVTICGYATEKNSSNLDNQIKPVLSGIPYFTYSVMSSGCDHEARINDVLDYPKLMVNYTGEGQYFSDPISDLMTSGKNTISIKVSPTKQYKKLVKLNSSCDVTASLSVESPKHSDNFVTIAKIVYHTDNAGKITNETTKFKGTTSAGRYSSNTDFTADKNGDVIVAPLRVKSIKSRYGSGLELSLDITLPMRDFPRWPWFDGDTIENNQATKDSLYDQYQIIWQAIHYNDLKRIKPELDFRDNRTVKALSLPTSDLISGSSVALIQQDIDDPNYKLVKLTEEKNTYLFINGDGKLARLLTLPTNKTLLGINQTPIGFYFEKEDNLDFYDFVFYRKNGKWILN